jgi:arsenical-resistance protein 2
MADNTPREVPWHAAYPAPKSVAASLPRHKLLQWFHDGKKAGKDFVLVDVRRTDFEVCSVYPYIDLSWWTIFGLEG